MTAGNRMKNIIALIPNVGKWEAASAEGGSHDVLLWRRTCVWKVESNTIRTERERERHKEYSSIIKSMQQLQMNINVCKRLQSHFI